MTVLANFLRALVVDPRSRRAMDETLLDAGEEISRSRGTVGRNVASVRAAFAVARVIALSFGRELRHLHAMPVAIVLVATFSVPIAVTALTGLPLAESAWSRAIHFGLLTTGPVAVFFPVSAFSVYTEDLTGSPQSRFTQTPGHR